MQVESQLYRIYERGDYKMFIAFTSPNSIYVLETVKGRVFCLSDFESMWVRMNRPFRGYVSAHLVLDLSYNVAFGHCNVWH